MQEPSSYIFSTLVLIVVAALASNFFRRGSKSNIPVYEDHDVILDPFSMKKRWQHDAMNILRKGSKKVPYQ